MSDRFIKESDLLKGYELQFGLLQYKTMTVLMKNAGQLTAIDTAGITNLNIKVNSGGTYSTPTLPLSYNAMDVLYLQFDYTDTTLVTGNIILTGKEN